MPGRPGAEVIVVDKKKKPTKKLGAQELEKRKAPFASPIVNREGEGRTGGAGTETVGSRIPDDEPGRTQGPLPKAPIIERIE